MGNFKYTAPKNYDFRDGQDALFDFECWTRIGPFCDAPNAVTVPIQANDVPDFLRNTRWAGQGPKDIFDGTSEVISQPVDRNGVQTCFGEKFCMLRSTFSQPHRSALEIDEKVSDHHRREGCVLRAGDLHAAYADLLYLLLKQEERDWTSIDVSLSIAKCAGADAAQHQGEHSWACSISASMCCLDVVV